MAFFTGIVIGRKVFLSNNYLSVHSTIETIVRVKIKRRGEKRNMMINFVFFFLFLVKKLVNFLRRIYLEAGDYATSLFMWNLEKLRYDPNLILRAAFWSSSFHFFYNDVITYYNTNSSFFAMSIQKSHFYI